MITGDILRKICPTLKPELAETISCKINTICPLYGINNKDILQEFIANIAEESGELQSLAENLNYSTEALIKNFGRHRITIDQANRYGRNSEHVANQKALANILYGGNFGKVQLGNIQAMDGWNFRGGGLLQLSGRSGYLMFTLFYNKKYNTKYTVEEMANLIRSNYDFALHSACWIFAIAKKLIPYSIGVVLKNFETIVRRINGGLNGFEKRKIYFERAVKYLGSN